jgi:uncharacterized protein
MNPNNPPPSRPDADHAVDAPAAPLETPPAPHAATLADGITHALDPRWITYRRRVAWASTLVLALALTAGAAILIRTAGFPAALVAASAFVLVVARAGIGQWWPAVAYRYASYRIGARALEIRRGVLWRSVIDVPRSRIQHSDVSQGPFERRHGLGTLDVYTAGTTHARVRLHGLAHERALAIRNHLMHALEDDVV